VGRDAAFAISLLWMWIIVVMLVKSPESVMTSTSSCSFR
jgi:hypothetical protein